MTDETRQLGSVFNYSGSTPVTGWAPAKVTSASLRLANKGEVKLQVGLPNDPYFSSYAVYVQENTSLTEPTFLAGSPHDRDKATKLMLGGLKPGVRIHVWVVTQDKYGTPASPTAPANTVYAGNIVPQLTSTLNIG
jgi:hypothetical protein